jgi:hypothetical protein
MLRDDNQKVSKKVLVLEKKLKDITGISISNSNLVDAQIEGFLKKSNVVAIKQKDTPFLQRKKGAVGNSRYQMLLDYYNQFTNPGGANYSSLMGDLDKNQSAM